MEIKRRGLKKIENVEGLYHTAYVEGISIIASAKSFLVSAVVYFLSFTAFVLLLTIIGGLNFYILGFEVAFIVIFIAMLCVGNKEKNRGYRQVLHAVNASNEWAVIFKTAKSKKIRKSTIKAMSGDIDKYDAKSKKRTKQEKIARKKKRKQFAKRAKEFDNSYKSAEYLHIFENS